MQGFYFHKCVESTRVDVIRVKISVFFNRLIYFYSFLILNKYFMLAPLPIFLLVLIITIRLIVSITKFSIVIGHPRAHFLRNRRAVTWVSNYSYPIATFCNWVAVIGHLRCARVNYVHLKGFFFDVSLQVSNLMENILDNKIPRRPFHLECC